MNSVNIIGRATDKPEIRYVGPTNRPVAEFTLAYDDRTLKPDASGKYPAYFFFIVIWGTKAEIAANQIVKGQRIGVTGRLTQDTFTPKGSTATVTKTRIVAETFDLLDKPGQRHDQTVASAMPDQPPAPDYPPAATDQPDDIPF